MSSNLLNEMDFVIQKRKNTQITLHGIRTNQINKKLIPANFKCPVGLLNLPNKTLSVLICTGSPILNSDSFQRHKDNTRNKNSML